VADVPSRSTRVLVVMLALGALVAGSCERLSAKKIGTIVGQLDTYDGRTITVIGTVEERIDVPAVKCFILNDGTGSIGVVTRGRLPLVGQKVLAKGRVQRSFTIGARKLTVVIEQPKPTPTAPRNQGGGRRGPG
jgi:hypothetical protein